MRTTFLRKGTSFLLSGALTLGMLIFPASADSASAVLDFQYPEDVDPAEVTLTVYEGYPAASGEDAVTALPQAAQDADGSYLVSSPGTYCYWVRGDGYYNICKIFNVTQEDLDAGTVELTVETGPLEEDGYQPTNPGLTNTPEGFSQDSRDALLTIWSDEIL